MQWWFERVIPPWTGMRNLEVDRQGAGFRYEKNIPETSMVIKVKELLSCDRTCLGWRSSPPTSEEQSSACQRGRCWVCNVTLILTRTTIIHTTTHPTSIVKSWSTSAGMYVLTTLQRRRLIRAIRSNVSLRNNRSRSTSTSCTWQPQSAVKNTSYLNELTQ